MLSPGATRLYIFLGELVQKHPGVHPFEETLASELGVSGKSIQRYISELRR